MEEGPVVNSLAAVGSRWPSRGLTCCKSSKDPGRTSPTADAAPSWSWWIAPANAAQFKSAWLVSIPGLDLEAILHVTDFDKHPAEAQSDLTSSSHRLICELSSVPYLFHFKQLTVTHRDAQGWDTPAPANLAQGGHICMIPFGWLLALRAAHGSDHSQPVAWGITMQGHHMTPAELLLPTAGHCPPCPVWAGSLENTQASPSAHTGWI